MECTARQSCKYYEGCTNCHMCGSGRLTWEFGCVGCADCHEAHGFERPEDDEDCDDDEDDY